MATFNTPGINYRMVQCPYDRNHKVPANRLNIHIIKCQKSYNGNEWSICSYNHKHRVLKNEMNKHLKECTEFKGFQSKEYAKSEYDYRNVNYFNTFHKNPINHGECWDVNGQSHEDSGNANDTPNEESEHNEHSEI